jgi:hypothetical protein
MTWKRGHFMGDVAPADASTQLMAMGLDEKAAAVAVQKYAGNLEGLISDIRAASDSDRAQWLEGIKGDPLYTMTPAQYADYVAGQQGQALAMRAGESARLFDVAQARAADPEVAARVDQYGGLTEYGAEKFRAENPEIYSGAGGKKGLIIIGAITAGLVAFILIRKRHK